MAIVNNCPLPDELFYDVDSNVWARREADGTVTVGMTSYACSLAGELVAYLPKKVGTLIERGKSLASVESGKWVGPIKAPVSGEIIGINEAVAARPSLINADPYGQGWAVKMQPADWDGEAGRLVTGSAVAAAFETKMAADGFVGR
ncbi:MAG TPA: glycine cleavage system protein H [Rhodocyclaceae bacterium]|nr:glycine cleavage system protein H [Rhodocyclaceae bacterium]